MSAIFLDPVPNGDPKSRFSKKNEYASFFFPRRFEYASFFSSTAHISNDSTIFDHTLLVAEIFTFKGSEMSGLMHGGSQ